MQWHNTVPLRLSISCFAGAYVSLDSHWALCHTVMAFDNYCFSLQHDNTVVTGYFILYVDKDTRVLCEINTSKWKYEICCEMVRQYSRGISRLDQYHLRVSWSYFHWIRYGTIEYQTTRHDTIKCHALAQCNAVQHSIRFFCIACNLLRGKILLQSMRQPHTMDQRDICDHLGVEPVTLSKIRNLLWILICSDRMLVNYTVIIECSI